MLLSPSEIADARSLISETMTLSAMVMRGTLGENGRKAMAVVWEGPCGISHVSTYQEEDADRLHGQDVLLCRFPVTADVRGDDKVVVGGVARTVIEVEEPRSPFQFQKRAFVTSS